MLIGYARISTPSQNLDAQIDVLVEAGAEKVYSECVSGAKEERPELDRLLNQVRKGDVVMVVKLDRLGRSTRELLSIVGFLEESGADFISLGDSLDTSTASGRLIFHVMASISEFERDMIQERTRAGLQAARARGRTGGRPATDPTKLRQALKMYDTGEFSLSEITAATGVSRSVIYRNLKKKASSLSGEE